LRRCQFHADAEIGSENCFINSIYIYIYIFFSFGCLQYFWVIFTD
jgi:hypothetical protein